MKENPFYRPVQIGRVQLEGNLFLAPVAGYSDRAFRTVCIDGGANFTYTEMVSSEALTRSSVKTEQIMFRSPNEKAYSVQLFGGLPETMARAAEIVIQKVNPEIIDINAGCPVAKIVKTGAGSSLTRDPERLFAITKATVEAAGSTPVTVKIRSGWDSSSLTWKEAALAALEGGAQALTIHSRTRAQAYEGKADWNILKALVELIDGRVPVFGSGDAFTPQDAKAMFEHTNCDGIMFARGAMGNPFIFRETREYLLTGNVPFISSKERLESGFKELSLLIEDKGEELACREMRKRFCAYSKGLPNAARLREHIVACSSPEDYRKVFNPFMT